MNTRVRVGDIHSAVLEGINDSKELRRTYRDFVDDVEETWKQAWEASGPHPYETGAYISHLKKKMPAKYKWIKKFLRKGIPIGAVYNDSPIAVMVEYGTGPDKPGGHSPWGPNTPTKAYAPMRKTAARYGG